MDYVFGDERFRFALPLLLSLLCADAAAQAIYTDRPAWESTANGSNITVMDLRTDTNGQPLTPGSYSSLSIDGVTFYDVWEQADGSFVTQNRWIDIDLAPGTTGFGLNLAPIYPADPPSPKTYTFAFADGQTLTSTATTRTYTQDFRGVAGGPPMTSVRISIESGPLYIEDFRYYLGVIEVPVDVRPGSERKPVNPKARGNLPVAILGTATFDVHSLDTSSIRFGLTGQENSVQNYYVSDVNADGIADLMLDVDNTKTGVVPGTTSVRLTGKTTTGVYVRGHDTIQTVPK